MIGWETVADWQWEDVERLLERMESLGPIPAILLPFVEALLPFLPLVAILVANVNAYGLGEGILYSWIGVSAGAICVFLLARLLGRRFRAYAERKLPRFNRMMEWVEKKGFTPIFVLACFPFTPSSLVNITAGISRIPIQTFITATLLGKGVMIMLVSVVGHDLGSLIQQPWRLVLAVAGLVLLWWFGKRVETRYTS